ncbi:MULTISPECIES: oligosaccharide flippase family protein [Mesonia]|uniref:Uncharacterized protein n=1 Tax=Mesonia oceanica TaxID=2687242 RepID=A0AC61Y8P8_9FLAO|nr:MULTISPECIES: oligosaccharide flippase family protein [Mesonia]MAN28949.1 hypothetical protein [Mesonia sp.]MAQ42729.1 hypothetical protein [Mesonia sp.]MBJ99267.1 hypothetical protein [Flavobacteriaceae bacterium]VVU99734.1 hypothetical protein FVB9532_00991 [Mesonia oceanica]|tara:strand:- start:21165 stop:22622 length:1458 start_codon:yes stop_codon:yes gene_type:complete
MSLIKQGGLITSSRILQYFLSFIFTFLVAKFYGAEKLGNYVFLYSLVSLFTPLVTLGGKQGLMYYLPIWGSKNELKSRMSNLITTSLLGTVVLGFLIWLIFVLFDNKILLFFENNLNNLPVFWWFSSIIIFEGLNQLFSSIFRGLKDFGYFSIGLFITTLFRIILVLTLYFFSFNSNVIIIAYFGGAILTTLFYVVVAFKIKAFTGANLKTFKYYFLMVRSFYPVVLTGFILVFQDKFAPLFIKYFLNSTDLGVYSVAIKIASFSSFFLISLNMLISPLISELFGKNKLNEIENIYRLSTRFLALGNYVFILVVITFGQMILTFFGKEFKIVYGILLIMCLGQLVNAITGSSSQIITMMGRPKALTAFSVIALLFSIATMFFLTPYFGLYGVAVGTALSLMVYNFLSAWYISKKFNIRAFSNKTFVYFSTQFAILAILFLYKEYTGEASIVMKSSLLIIGLVSLVLLHFKVFWREDLKFIERIKK